MAPVCIKRYHRTFGRGKTGRLTLGPALGIFPAHLEIKISIDIPFFFLYNDQVIVHRCHDATARIRL